MSEIIANDMFPALYLILKRKNMKRIMTIWVMILFFLLTGSFLLFAQIIPFTKFDVQPGLDRSVLVHWGTNSQRDTIWFEVERSSDKKVWVQIAVVASNVAQQYSWSDTDPIEGMNYYRVKEAGGNGRFLYSPAKWLQMNEAAKLIIWPNPADNILYVKTPFNTGSIDIINSGGRLVQKITITNYVTIVQTQKLSKDLYFLHVKNKTETLIERFIKD